MNCPMCGVQLEDDAQMCRVCGCKIAYNGYRGNVEQTQTLHNNKSKPNYKRIAIIGCCAFVVVLFIAIFPKGNGQKTSANSGSGYVPYTTTTPTTNSNVSGNPAVYDWFKENAQGKDYNNDDGGEYYCMGKNDTCPNRTHNAFDLYCDSCDPDGDNVEG